MARLVFLCILFIGFTASAVAQKPDSVIVPVFNKGLVIDTIPYAVPLIILSGDTLPVVEMNPILIYPPYEFKNKRQRKRYSRLVYNIQVVYPYAKLAAEKLKGFLELKKENDYHMTIAHNKKGWDIYTSEDVGKKVDKFALIK